MRDNKVKTYSKENYCVPAFYRLKFDDDVIKIAKEMVQEKIIGLGASYSYRGRWSLSFLIWLTRAWDVIAFFLIEFLLYV